MKDSFNVIISNVDVPHLQLQDEFRYKTVANEVYELPSKFGRTVPQYLGAVLMGDIKEEECICEISENIAFAS